MLRWLMPRRSKQPPEAALRALERRRQLMRLAEVEQTDHSLPVHSRDVSPEMARERRNQAELAQLAQVFRAEGVFNFNDCLSQTKLENFERRYSFRLPDGYREYLLHVGNGGPGPHNGIQRLELSLPGPDCDASRVLSGEAFFPWLVDDFPFTGDRLTDDQVLATLEYLPGCLRICHEGCGYYYLLVVAGPRRGDIWHDGTVSDQGIAPCRLHFVDWYEAWLRDVNQRFGVE